MITITHIRNAAQLPHRAGSSLQCPGRCRRTHYSCHSDGRRCGAAPLCAAARWPRRRAPADPRKRSLLPPPMLSPRACRTPRRLPFTTSASSPKSSCPANASKSSGSGRHLGWVVRPLDAVGCYVPSGRYPLPSTLLMTAVLAQVAGVPRICVTSPKPSKEILGCASPAGTR